MHSRQRDHDQLYLASNSPRRRELLSLTGLEYQLLPARVDETPLTGEEPSAYVRRVAGSKAAASAAVGGEDAVIIAADTAVVDGLTILGKPADQADAAAMLRRLRGHVHQVYSAISILPAQDGTIRSDLCITDVPMRRYTDSEIETYVSSADPLDKAGGYAIQHSGFHPVSEMHGCYANVMGLPLCHLVRNLRTMGIIPPADVPHACQAALEYHCPVFQAILNNEI